MIKVNQKVKIKTAVINGYEKLVPKSYEKKHEVKEFLVLSIPNYANDFYSILVEDQMLGWTVDLSHVTYFDVNKKYLGKKFFDVNEEYFVF